MGLEYDPQLLVRIIKCSRQGCADFLRMMGVIIDNGDSSQLSLLLKTTVCACEIPQSLPDHLLRYPQLRTHSHGGQGVIHIVLTGNTQSHGIHNFPVHTQVKDRPRQFVETNMLCTVLTALFFSKCNDTAGQPLRNLSIIRYIAVDDQNAVIRQLLGKQAEGMANIVQILEEIEMVCLHV